MDSQRSRLFVYLPVADAVEDDSNDVWEQWDRLTAPACRNRVRLRHEEDVREAPDPWQREAARPAAR